LPSSVHSDEFGESSQESALPWDEINPTEFKTAGNIKDFLSRLRQKHEERIEASSEFDYLRDDLQDIKKQKENNLISLNEEVRRKEMEKDEEEKFRRENERRKVKGIELLDKGEEIKDSPAPDDLYLDETARILADLVAMTVG